MSNEQRYRVRSIDSDGRPVQGLSYPSTAAWHAKLVAAAIKGPEEASAARRAAEEAGAFVHVKPGDDCTAIQATSRPWLLAQGLIELTPDEPADTPAAPVKRTKKER